MERHDGYASAISIWERRAKIRRSKLDIGISVEEFSRRIEQSSTVQLLAVDTATWLRCLMHLVALGPGAVAALAFPGVPGSPSLDG